MRTTTTLEHQARARVLSGHPTWLHLVTPHELEDLRDELARGHVPPDLEDKLVKLRAGGLAHGFVEQQSRTFIALLQAAHAGTFAEFSPAELERLLKVLAYVRKDDDAIPDYRPDGFLDDQQEVRAATTELGRLLQAFKTWRLRYQVPRLWLENRQTAQDLGLPPQTPLASFTIRSPKHPRQPYGL